jgi:uncharacterized protein YciI
MPTYVVEYHYTRSPAELAAHRPEHRAFLRGLLDAGALVASGPLPEAGGALLVVRADDEAAALRLLDADPFRREGLIADRSTREWDPVIRSWD